MITVYGIIRDKGDQWTRLGVHICTGIYTGTSEVSWTSVEQCAGGGYEVRSAGQYFRFLYDGWQEAGSGGRVGWVAQGGALPQGSG